MGVLVEFRERLRAALRAGLQFARLDELVEEARLHRGLGREVLRERDRALVGRRVEPVLQHRRRDPAQAYVAPRDVLELELTKIWEELLGVRPVGIRDDFFKLGGHSLAAVRLTARIQQRLGRELGVDPSAVEFDLDGVKASMGLEPTVNRVTYRELQERRELIQRRMRDHVETGRSRLAT